VQKKIAILGFRGVGKSTVSKLLGKLTGLPLYVLDSSIEVGEGKSIARIVEETSWNHFRQLELQYLKAQADRDEVIVDCGGGVLEGADGAFSAEKAEILKRHFFCVYLYLPDAKLLTRLGKIKNKSSRPALQGDLQKILEKRKPWFEQIADVVINTDGMTPYRIANLVRKRLKKGA